MKSLKYYIPVFLVILFEAVVGILLFSNPEGFTRLILTLFGIVLIAIGALHLIRYSLDKRKNAESPLSLIVGVVALVIGAVCAFCSGLIIGIITAIAIIYGVILAIFGIYKVENYFLARKAKAMTSVVSLAGGIFAVLFGVIIVLYPKDAAFSVWYMAGIALIAEALIDIFSLVQIVRSR